MKKSLLAVAVAAALPTFAQAQSSVTMFGLLDVGVEYSNAQANATVSDLTTNAVSVASGKSGLRVREAAGTGSRFGVRGSEDLGGGLKAVFTIEHRLSVDTGDTAGGGFNTAANGKFWNGQAWVGLEGGWGRLTAGRQYSPIFWMLLPADFTGYQYYNNWAGTSGQNVNTVGTGITQGAIRLDNSLSYKSPTMGGVTIYGVYAPGENLQAASAATGSGTTGSGDLWGLAGSYQLGGLYLGLGYHAQDTKAYGTGAVNQTAQAAFQNLLAATGSYNFGNMGLSLGYTKLNFKNIGGTDPSISNILFSGYANVGTGKIILSMVQHDFSNFTGARNDSGLNYGLTYVMPLSKRTDVFATYGVNDVSGIQPTTASSLIDNQQRLSVGLQHRF